MSETPTWDETEAALGIDADGDGTIGGVSGPGDGEAAAYGDRYGNDSLDPDVVVATESEFATLESQVFGDHEMPDEQSRAKDDLGKAAIDLSGEEA